jgi:hypothetical protein
MFSRDGLCSARNVRPGRVDADEGHVVRRRPESAEINGGCTRRVRDILPVEGRVLVLQAGQLARRSLNLVRLARGGSRTAARLPPFGGAGVVLAI